MGSSLFDAMRRAASGTRTRRVNRAKTTARLPCEMVSFMMVSLKVIPNFLNLPVEPAVDTMSGINPQIQRLEKVSLLKNSLYLRLHLFAVKSALSHYMEQEYKS